MRRLFWKNLTQQKNDQIIITNTKYFDQNGFAKILKNIFIVWKNHNSIVLLTITIDINTNLHTVGQKNFANLVYAKKDKSIYQGAQAAWLHIYKGPVYECARHVHR